MDQGNNLPMHGNKFNCPTEIYIRTPVQWNMVPILSRSSKETLCIKLNCYTQIDTNEIYIICYFGPEPLLSERSFRARHGARAQFHKAVQQKTLLYSYLCWRPTRTRIHHMTFWLVTQICANFVLTSFMPWHKHDFVLGAHSHFFLLPQTNPPSW